MKRYEPRALHQSKAVTFARKSMVATAQYLATYEALRVMSEGGNAYDAAVVAATMTGVTLPACCGLGGDAFALVYEPSTGKVEALNGSGIGQNVTIAEMKAAGYAKMPVSGALSIGMPGACDVYGLLAEKARLPLSRLLAPAIACAEEGFILTETCALNIALAADKTMADPDTAAIFGKGGRTPATGALVRNPDLARSLETVAREGFRTFYEGELGDRVLAGITAKGAKFTRQQWREHRTDVAEPLSVGYRGYEVLTTPPPSQGMILAAEMRILEHFPLADWGHNSAKTIHTMVEAKKQAFASRIRWAGDPRFVKIDWEKVLGDGAAAAAAARIDPARACTKGEFLNLLREEDGDTTSFSVVDGEGRAVSLIHSLSNRMGSGVTAPGTGILLNNRAGRGFLLVEGYPNALAPGKRTMHTLLPWMMLKDGRPAFLGNTVGGDNQPQWNMQCIVNAVDFGMNPEQVVSAPRWYSYPGTDPEHFDNDFLLTIEDGVDEDTCAELARLGHRIERIERYAGGGGQMFIAIREDGTLAAGCDPRSDGAALGF